MIEQRVYDLEFGFEGRQKQAIADANKRLGGERLHLADITGRQSLHNFMTHGPCSSKDRRWIHQLDIDAFELTHVDSFHPNQKGHNRLAAIMERLIIDAFQ